ncbi:MAG: PEP-CTERM sorting domain-containing protein [Gemmataceae bacterium]|nr:PEP-CTERM sorting domain-containing protein [Gemmataceae bacterium]
MRPRPATLLGAALAVLLCSAPARAGYYRFDELSPRNYPSLQDCLMYVLNDNGVAAGYVALDTPYGPYLPATHTFGGPFNPIPGLSSTSYSGTATGISNTGTVVGQLGGVTPPYYLYAGGAVRPVAGGPGYTVTALRGVNPNGVAYGTGRDDAGRRQVFTTTDGTAQWHPLEADGFTNFSLPFGFADLMNADGLLAVRGFTLGGGPFAYYLYDTVGGGLTRLELPAGYTDFPTFDNLTPTTLFGYLYDGVNPGRYGEWNLDGTFAGFFDPPGGGYWDSVAVNDLGQAVGFAGGTFWTYDGTTWETGVFLGRHGAQPFVVYDLNNRGELVGGTFVPGSGFYWGFMATPTALPEPASLSLVAAGGLGLLGFARRRKAAAG